MLKKKKRITKTLRMAVLLPMLVCFLLWGDEVDLQVYANGTAKVTASSGKIREKANTGSEVLGSVNKGDTLEVTASTKDSQGYTWYKVFVNGQRQGYIRGDLVQVEGNISPESASNTSSGQGSVTTVGSGGNVTTVGSGGNVTTVGQGGSTATQTSATGNAQNQGVAPSQVAKVRIKNAGVNIRAGAGTTGYEIVTKTEGATEVSVSGEARDSEGKLWYQISFDQGGSTVNGFVREDFVEVLENVPPTTEQPPVSEGNPETAAPVNEDFYLKYAQNDTGEWDWYLFDQREGTSQSLTKLLAAVEQIQQGEDAEKSQVSTMKIIIIVMAAVLILLVVAVTVLMFKLHDAYTEDEEDEEEADEEAEEEEEEQVTVSQKRFKLPFGRKAQGFMEEDEEEEEEEEEEPARNRSRRERSKETGKEKGTWQSKDFLELDDDMEFEFLDL